jgi:oxygen-independent coproporphyrinogen-3 oxidase
LYGLTYEPGTALTAQYKRGQVQSCDEELERAMYNHAIDRLADAGFEHYEISNFARPGQRCRHNVAYWRNAEYVGFGPSAASFLDRRRLRNVANLTEYVRRMHTDGEAIDESERLEPLAFAGETAMLSLRMTDGIEAAGFASTTGYDPFVLFAEPIRRHTAAGLLATDNHRIRLTRAGLCVADAVMADFLDPTAPNENTLVRESFLAPTEAGILSRVVTRQGNRHGDQVN